MWRVLEYGGIIGIRPVDDRGRIISPTNQGLEDY
jgi:hypothetical protein